MEHVDIIGDELCILVRIYRPIFRSVLNPLIES